MSPDRVLQQAARILAADPALEAAFLERLTGLRRLSAETIVERSAALEDFVKAVEDTGGVLRDRDSYGYAPAADEGWLDLGAAYMRACEALGREPDIQDDVDYGDQA